MFEVKDFFPIVNKNIKLFKEIFKNFNEADSKIKQVANRSLKFFSAALLVPISISTALPIAAARSVQWIALKLIAFAFSTFIYYEFTRTIGYKEIFFTKIDNRKLESNFQLFVNKQDKDFRLVLKNHKVQLIQALIFVDLLLPYNQKLLGQKS